MIKKILREIIAFIFILFTPRFAKGGVILMYHSIGYNNRFSTVTPERFERQLQYIKKQSYRVIRLQELIKIAQAGDDLAGTVALSFDDAYLDFYTVVFPLLEKYEMTATLFVPTGLVYKNTDNKVENEIPMMNVDQIKEIAKSGLVSVMPHTVAHKKLHGLTTEEAISEIEQSRDSIKGWVDSEADILAYPSGRYTSNIVQYLSQSDSWFAAVAVEPGLVLPTSNFFELKRYSVDSSTGKWSFRLKLRGKVILNSSFK